MYHNSNANFVNGITLNVRDKNELKPFYEDILGLNIINETLTSIQYEVGQIIMSLHLLNYKMDVNL